MFALFILVSFIGCGEKGVEKYFVEKMQNVQNDNLELNTKVETYSVVTLPQDIAFVKFSNGLKFVSDKNKCVMNNKTSNTNRTFKINTPLSLKDESYSRRFYGEVDYEANLFNSEIGFNTNLKCTFDYESFESADLNKILETILATTPQVIAPEKPIAAKFEALKIRRDLKVLAIQDKLKFEVDKVGKCRMSFNSTIADRILELRGIKLFDVRESVRNSIFDPYCFNYTGKFNEERFGEIYLDCDLNHELVREQGPAALIEFVTKQ